MVRERQRASAPLRCGLAALAFWLFVAPALAAGPDGNGISSPSIAPSLPDNGNPTGTRKWLADRGITFNAIYTGEVLSNVSGGIRRGTVYEGKLEINTTVDLGKVADLPGLTFYTNGFQIHPTGGISRRYVGNFQTISAIEALPATRLSELWLEQRLFDGKLGIRVGQLAADSEFFIAGYSLPFINSDWPAITKQNLPSGGPAYPLSTPGIRVRFDPNDRVSVLGAIFNGDPGGRGTAEPEIRNRTGTRFPLGDPALLMQEVQYRYHQEPDSASLAGIARVGAWQHLGKFNSQRVGTDDPSRNAPDMQAAPRLLKGNFGLYAVLDQQIYRLPGGDPNSGITAFGRISASPSDRNLVRFYLDGGFVFTGMVPGRPFDAFGATFLYSEISKDARALDKTTIILSGVDQPRRAREVTAELTYVAQVRPGWTVQPDLQYIFHPGGSRAPKDAPAGSPAIRNATVLGLRTTINY